MSKWVKETCTKIHGEKILYKIFSRPDEDEGMIPLCASSLYVYKGNLGNLTVKNAKGFEVFKIIGEIGMCEHGFHAVEKERLSDWVEGWKSQRVYKVKLFNCWKRKRETTGKWVGTHFKILQRVTKFGAKPRRWRD